ncbi:MAG: GIY-YIG nuclease family protein [Halothece sp. Uz-M2-17]|nr:GIY-YIG nuclease family protein [Halothece sp. Uz-M2-17]
MTAQTELTALADLAFIPYLNENGEIDPNFEKKIGVYSIFNGEKNLQFVAYSRDIYTSLKQHLVRQPESCYWVKVKTIDRPRRSTLDEIKNAWIEENGTIPPGNRHQQSLWTDPIDAKLMMTDAEQQEYANADDIAQTKLLKNVARRVEAEIKETLKLRGVKMEMRFNPKLKEQGRLDLK